MSRLGAIRAILFDLDGTLIDSAPDLGAAADKLRVARGLSPLGPVAYRYMAGAGARGMLQVAFGIGPDAESYESLKNEFLANYARALLVHTRAFDGVAELLAALEARSLVWGIVTNKAERFALPLVQAMPLLSGAQVVIGGDTTAHSKPHPAPLLEAARRLGLGAELCMYVGDDERDIVAGHAAGMVTVSANYGYLGEKLDTSHWGAAHAIENPADLLKLLDSP